MAKVTAKYGDNVKAEVTIKNVGGAPGRFRLKGKLTNPTGYGNFWDRLVRGDPQQAQQLMQQAGAKDFVETPNPLPPGGTAVLTMWTAPLWKPPDVATVINRVDWTLTCLETGQSAILPDPDAIAVTGQGAASIVNVVYSVA